MKTKRRIILLICGILFILLTGCGTRNINKTSESTNGIKYGRIISNSVNLLYLENDTYKPIEKIPNDTIFEYCDSNFNQNKVYIEYDDKKGWISVEDFVKVEMMNGASILNYNSSLLKLNEEQICYLSTNGSQLESLLPKDQYFITDIFRDNNNLLWYEIYDHFDMKLKWVKNSDDLIEVLSSHEINIDDSFVIEFESDALKTTLLNHLEVEGEEVTYGMIKDLESIVIQGNEIDDISSIKGLRFFKNLKVLYIPNVKLYDIKEISRLRNLESLSIYGSSVINSEGLIDLLALNNLSLINSEVNGLETI